jgi:hypothetical protein
MPAGAGAARRAYRDRRSVTAIHELIEVTRSSRLTALCAIFLSSGMPVFVGFSTFFRIPEAAEDPESGHYRSPDRVFPRFSALKYKKIAQSAGLIKNSEILP